MPLINDAKSDWDKKKTSLEEFDDEFKYKSVDKLITYCKRLIKPAATYYMENFNHPEGDLYKLKQCVRVAQLFNPFFVKDKPIAALELLADDLFLT